MLVSASIVLADSRFIPQHYRGAPVIAHLAHALSCGDLPPKGAKSAARAMIYLYKPIPLHGGTPTLLTCANVMWMHACANMYMYTHIVHHPHAITDCGGNPAVIFAKGISHERFWYLAGALNGAMLSARSDASQAALGGSIPVWDDILAKASHDIVSGIRAELPHITQ